MSRVSRRDVLKLALAAVGGMAFLPTWGWGDPFDDAQWGRVTIASVSAYREPNDQSPIVATWYRDDLIRLYETVVAEAPAHNPIWYRVWGGYVHRARIQRVKIVYQEPLSSIPQGTRYLAEVTVPYTSALGYNPLQGWFPRYRLYYGSVHWIEGIEQGPDGEAWYQIYDELLERPPYFVPARHLRPILPEEYAPLSPDVPWEAKRIEVNLTTQTLTAYENDVVVLETKISSGIPFGGRRRPGEIPTKTPAGEFNILEKTPSKHMGDGNLAADIEDYELPGVPWTCFFTDKGHAFHGTYWHDNFGTPMSHGCINMRTEEALWLFRWAYPQHKADAIYNRGYGTRVKIFY